MSTLPDRAPAIGQSSNSTKVHLNQWVLLGFIYVRMGECLLAWKRVSPKAALAPKILIPTWMLTDSPLQTNFHTRYSLARPRTAAPLAMRMDLNTGDRKVPEKEVGISGGSVSDDLPTPLFVMDCQQALSGWHLMKVLRAGILRWQNSITNRFWLHQGFEREFMEIVSFS